MRKAILTGLILFWVSGAAFAQQYIISTVAGNGTSDFSGDGGLATSTSLLAPRGVAVDGSGNLYIGDSGNQRIRKVYAAFFGIITTVAGNGTAGLSGDGGPAGSASLSYPGGVAVDGAGNLYIADSGNQRIRKVDTAGIITTVAGNGVRGFSGDGRPAGSASLSYPGGVAVDGAGNLYIADSGNQRIRKVDTAGIITTVAGNGTAGFTGDFGPATSARFNNPSGVAVDGAGNLYIADSGNQRIRKLSPGTVSSNLLVPWVSGLSPANAGAGNIKGFALTVYGSNFVSDSVVQWNGSNRSTTFVSSTELSATISAADLASPVTAQVSVLNPTSSGGISNSLTFPVQALSRIGSFGQVASGGGWETTMVLLNLSDSAVAARVSFFADDGTPLTFRIKGSVSSGPFTDVTIAPGSSVSLVSEASTAGLVTGWADVEASGALRGYSIFRLRLPGLPDRGSPGIPMDVKSAPSLTVPFDNTNGYVTGFALANQSTNAATITANLLDSTGAQITSTQINLPGLGHKAFYVPQQFPQSANQIGVIQFQSAAGGITGTGLRFDPSGSFTSWYPPF